MKLFGGEQENGLTDSLRHTLCLFADGAGHLASASCLLEGNKIRRANLPTSNTSEKEGEVPTSNNSTQFYLKHMPCGHNNTEIFLFYHRRRRGWAHPS